MTKDSSGLVFWQCQCATLKSILFTIGAHDLFFVCFHLCKMCFAFAGCANRTCQEYCVMLLQKRMASVVNISTRCGTDGQNMFLDGEHKFPGQPVAVHCALSPHLEHGLTGREKGTTVILLRKTRCSSRKTNWLDLTPHSPAHPTPNRKGIGQRGQQLVPRADTIHNTCFTSKSLDSVDGLNVFIPLRELRDITV